MLRNKLLRASNSAGITIDYYVSSSGNDSNDGLTSGTAFATLAKAQSVVAAGETIGLARGSRFREDLLLPTTHNARVVAYGSGPMPIIDGSRVVNETWTKTAGQTNVWQITVTQTVSEGYQQVFEDDTPMRWATSIANVDANAGRYFISGPSAGDGKTAAGSLTIYIHATGSGNPNSNGKLYEITDPTRYGQLRVGNNCTVEYIRTQRNSHPNGSLEAGYRASIVHCLMMDGIKHESLISSGIYRDCHGVHRVDDARTNNIVMELFTSNGTGEIGRWLNCTVSAVPGSTQAVVAFAGHTMGPGTYYSSVLAENCTAYGSSTGFEFDSPMTFTRCLASETSVAFSGNVSLVECAVKNTTIPLTRVITHAVSPSSISVTGFRAYINTAVNGQPAFYVNEINIDSAAFSFGTSVSTNYSLINPLVVGGTSSVQKLVLDRRTASDVITFMDIFVAHNYTGANNIFWPDGVNVRRPGGTFHNTASSYLTAVQPGNEVGSQVADPQFADPANLNFTIGNGALSAYQLANPNITYKVVPAWQDFVLE